MKLAGGSPSFANELNVDAFLEQVGEHVCLSLWPVNMDARVETCIFTGEVI